MIDNMQASASETLDPASRPGDGRAAPAPWPASGAPSHQRGRRRLHLVYFALAAVNLLTIGATLLLSHQLMQIYKGSVGINQSWAHRLNDFSKLAELAQITNAPGNDVFDSRDIAGERLRRDAGLMAFDAHVATLRASLSREDNPELLVALNRIADAMTGMVSEADLIFTSFENGKPEQAGQRMATMDRKYANLTQEVGAAARAIQAIQSQNFSSQLEAAKDLQQGEYAVGVLLLCMVLAVAVYGHKIGNAMRRADEEIRSYAQKLEDANGGMSRLNAELAHNVQKLERTRVELTKASRAKSLFLANMSHEIRTPMNGVFGMTDLLTRTRLDERQQRLVNTINQSATSLLTLINDILDISRIEAGRLELDRHELDLRHTVEETVDLLAESARRKGLDLSLYVDARVPEVLTGDGTRIRQVCTNLVSNAIKFTREGEVAVIVDCPELRDGFASIVISVRDTGIGIESGLQEKLFQPFQQADTSIARRYGGTGLGLSISRHLIEMMGGTVKLESQIGVGTRVTCSFPLEIASTEAPPKRPDDLDLKGRRVLVLDDKASNREIFASYLHWAGAEALCVANAEDALRALQRARRDGRPFALAIIDMVMPGTDGLALGLEIKKDPASDDLKLIMVTSLNWKGETQMARDYGFDAFLAKPLHRRELVGTACRLLRPQAEKAAPENALLEPLCRRGLRVLIAEDNPVNLEVAKESLVPLGCAEIVCAGNGTEAVSAYSEQSFDVILMDCQMPEMDGLAAARRIRELEEKGRLKAATIVAVTANAYEEDRIACIKAGMDDYISKPFPALQLERVLAKWHPAAASEPPSSAQPGPRPPETPVSGSKPVPSEHAPRIDMELLGRMRQTNADLLNRLIETYLAYAPKVLEQLLAAAHTQDQKMLSTGAHSLKSSSANVGAMHLSHLCRELEHMTRGESADAASFRPLADRIEREFSFVTSDLRAVQISIPRSGLAGARQAVSGRG